MSFSQIIIIGHLGADPELRYTKNQNPVLNMSVGVSENLPPTAPKDKKPKTHWHKCRRWGLAAENLGVILKKGDKVFIKGNLVYDVWEDKMGNKHKDAYIEVEHLEKMYYEHVSIDLGE